MPDGEHDVRDLPDHLVGGPRLEDVAPGPREDAGRIVGVEQHGAGLVHAAARREVGGDAVIDVQPALRDAHGGGPLPIRSSQLRGRPRITGPTTDHATRSSEAGQDDLVAVGRAVRVRLGVRSLQAQPPPPHPRGEQDAVAGVARGIEGDELPAFEVPRPRDAESTLPIEVDGEDGMERVADHREARVVDVVDGLTRRRGEAFDLDEVRPHVEADPVGALGRQEQRLAPPRLHAQQQDREAAPVGGAGVEDGRRVDEPGRDVGEVLPREDRTIDVALHETSSDRTIPSSVSSRSIVDSWCVILRTSRTPADGEPDDHDRRHDDLDPDVDLPVRQPRLLAHVVRETEHGPEDEGDCPERGPRVGEDVEHPVAPRRTPAPMPNMRQPRAGCGWTTTCSARISCSAAVQQPVEVEHLGLPGQRDDDVQDRGRRHRDGPELLAVDREVRDRGRAGSRPPTAIAGARDHGRPGRGRRPALPVQARR